MNDEDLQTLVDHFYAIVRRDELIGPLFNAAVSDWQEHLEKLGAFWSSVMLTSGRYKGNPMAAHLHHISAIEPAMFDRWLALWASAARGQLAPEAAEAVIAKAERISESLQLGLWSRVDGMATKATR